MTANELLIVELKNDKAKAEYEAEELREKMQLAKERAFAYGRAIDKVEAHFKNESDTPQTFPE